MNAARKEVLNGQLSDFAVSTLLHAFSLGRTVMTLEVMSSTGEVVGSVLLKSGKVLAANAGSLEGPEALDALMQERLARFRVFSEGTALHGHRPLGSVAELTSEARQVAAKPPSKHEAGAESVPTDTGVRARVPVMAGSLEEFDVASLMRVVSSGRQHTSIEILNDRSDVTGTIFLKAGKVVSARAGSVEGVAAVCEILDLPPKFNFAIFRVPTEVPYESIGSVDEILRLAMDPQRQATSGVVKAGAARAHADGEQRSRVMEGSVADADVASLLQVLGSSRQYTELEFFRPDGSVAGEIHIKAGKMLRATADEVDGVTAVRRLIAAPPDFRFRASRRLMESEIPLPVGEIGDVLMRAISEPPPPPAVTAPPVAAMSAAVTAPPARAAVPHAPPPRPMPAPTPVPSHVSAPAAAARQADARVMEGTLADFDVLTLMQVLSTSRQQTKLELFDTASRIVGTVRAKSGNLLSAETGTERGEAAVVALLRSPSNSTFVISRIFSVLEPGQASLGDLGDILRRAMSLASRAPSEHEPAAVAHSPTNAAAHLQAVAPAALPSPPHPAVPASSPRGSRWVLPVALVAAALVGSAAFVLVRSNSAPPREVSAAAPHVNAPAIVAPATVAPTAPVATAMPPAVVAPAVVAPAPVEPASRPTTKPERPRPAQAVAPQHAVDPAVRNAQAALARAGHDPGQIDGVLGHNTAEAIRAFQAAEHLPVTGTLNDRTRAALTAHEESSAPFPRFYESKEEEEGATGDYALLASSRPRFAPASMSPEIAP